MNYLNTRFVYTANSLHILCRTHTHTHTTVVLLTTYWRFHSLKTLLTANSLLPAITLTRFCQIHTNETAVITYLHVYYINSASLVTFTCIWMQYVYFYICTSYNRVPVAEGTQNMKLIYSIDNLHYICVILPSPTIKLQTGEGLYRQCLLPNPIM